MEDLMGLRTDVSIVDDINYHPVVVARMFKPTVITAAFVPCDEDFDVACYNCDMVMGSETCGERRINREPVFCSKSCKEYYTQDE